MQHLDQEGDACLQDLNGLLLLARALSSPPIVNSTCVQSTLAWYTCAAVADAIADAVAAAASAGAAASGAADAAAAASASTDIQRATPFFDAWGDPPARSTVFPFGEGMLTKWLGIREKPKAPSRLLEV